MLPPLIKDPIENIRNAISGILTMFITSSKSRSAWLTAFLVVSALALPEAWALPSINLTNSTYGTVAPDTSQADRTITNSKGSVIFQRDTTQPAGTGVFNPFLRLDAKGNGLDEQGYNTSAVKTTDINGNTTTRKILDNMSPVNWTHDVLLSDLLSITVGGIDYYQFKLDINEPGNNNSLLTLDGLRLYSTSTPGQSGVKLDTNGDIVTAPPTGGIVGTVLWDMDEGTTNNTDSSDRSVLLDAKLGGGPGSGIADMVMLVEKKVFAGTGAATHLILWSRFGMSQTDAKSDSCTDTCSEAGFEEWSYSSKSGSGGGGGCTTNCNQTPTPGTASLALLALGILGFRHRSLKTPVVTV